ncbi:hypothetical protein HC891_14165, partial [Candidatus Gracilibacteria bacterium]|nr:hypothetical protein [Candidatus Gracilibacteria bacterium]
MNDGHGIHLPALPLGTTLVSQALAAPAFGELLQFPRWWWEVPPHWRADPLAHALVQEA